MIAVTVKKFFPVFKVVLTLMVEAYGNHDHLYARLQVRRYTVVYSGFRMHPFPHPRKFNVFFLSGFYSKWGKDTGRSTKGIFSRKGVFSDMFGDGF
ncbi:hypothetical protein CEXT_136111 [Caerostris extrusa]|uniref:Uncharacterized protein n=1 Tax=Caerostris extrusa TaxID=172846 RepID=A0AAV4MKS2_CAEEX|nr:hypothetical protein CEXT_136111 [Caerostris extrusa]